MSRRFMGGMLTDAHESPCGKILGEGLFTPGSATPHELEGNVQSIRLGAVNHMGLLNDPRVYAQILAWLGNKE